MKKFFFAVVIPSVIVEFCVMNFFMTDSTFYIVEVICSFVAMCGISKCFRKKSTITCCKMTTLYAIALCGATYWMECRLGIAKHGALTVIAPIVYYIILDAVGSYRRDK